MIYQYPFGETSLPLRQEDRSPKKAFVLGVYASAVHAKWIKDGELMSQALPVADEPRLFWDGNEKEAKEIVGRVRIPAALGTLEPAASNYNGPAAKVLDENILAPLGLTRDDVWLCECLPEARLFPNQDKEIREKYNPLIREYDLNDVTIRKRPVVFCDEARAREIVDEIMESEAELLILLGDIAIGQFLNKAASVPYMSLQDFTEEFAYGYRHKVTIHRKEFEVLPLAHPRQIGVFGAYHEKWHQLHLAWEKEMKA